MKRFLLIAVLALPVVGFAQAKPDRQLIEQLRADWGIYLHTKQLDKAMAQYTDDAIFYSPGAPGIKGKRNITQLYQTVMKQFNANIKFYSSGISVSGNLASDGGDYTETMQDNTTHKTTAFKGSYLMVLQKQQNSWKINRIMWTAAK